MQIKQSEDFVSRNRTIKHNHLYLVDDPQGNVPYQNTSGMGLYHLDTRFLSCFEIKLQNTDPIPLLSSSDLGYMSTIVFTNGPLETTTEDGSPIELLPETIQLKRETVLYGLQFERYWLINYHNEAIRLELTFSFDADFKDMFEIRSIVPARDTALRPPIMDVSGQNPVLIFTHADQSGRHLQTGIRFVDLKPSINSATSPTTVVYSLLLQPREPVTFNYEIQTIVNDKMMNSGSIEASVSGMDEALSLLNFRTRRFHHDMTMFHSDNDDFNEMMSRNQKDMNMLMTHTDEGSYVAAGIPWYVALFGRDSLITSRFAMILNPAIGRESLKILAKYQGTKIDPSRDEEPGKILHELRVGELARLGEIPHTPYYGSVDATPLFIITLYDYFIWTNDRDTLAELWPNALKAMEWIDNNLQRHKHGYSTYESQCEGGILQQGWKDSHDSVMNAAGVIGKPPIALAEVQAYVYMAKQRLAKLADVMDDRALRQRMRYEAQEFRRRFNQDFWMDELEYCALGMDKEGVLFDVVSSNPGHGLEGFVFYEERGKQVVERLMASDMFNGWGIRTLSSKASAYNPMSYHNGTIWPHDNALIARGLAEMERPDLVAKVFLGLFESARHMYYRRLPELFCGFRKEEGKEGDPPVRYAVACSPQAWAAASMYSLIQSMLNLIPDAAQRTLRIKSPMLPPFLNMLQVNNLRIGEATVDLEFRRAPDSQLVTVDVRNRQGELDIIITL
jgi:glycogen debranching enzyme